MREVAGRLEYLRAQYENILGWYKQSEEKAKFLVTINTLVVGVVNGLVFVGAEKIATVRRVYTVSLWVLLLLSGLALIGSYLFILRAVWARHGGEVLKLKDHERLWFFGDIAAMSREEHQKLLDDWSEEHLEASLSAQNYILSRNVKTKYDSLNLATSLTIVALVLLFILGVTYGLTVSNV